MWHGDQEQGDVMKWSNALGIPAAAVAAVASYDLLQRRHAILRNFPVVGHGRYLLEAIGPELRQYIVTGNDEERPFSRDQRRWIYASSKQENNNFGFGTDNDIETPTATRSSSTARSPRRCRDGHRTPRSVALPSAQGPRRPARTGRKAFRPDSLVNISAMSFGSLSGHGDRGAEQGRRAGRLPAQHRRGRTVAVPPQRRRPGLPDRYGATSAAATSDGRFDLAAAQGGRSTSAPVRAIEIKLSQGAKPGLGGLLPGGEGDRRDRRDPRHPGGPRLRQPVAPHRVPRRRQHARLGRAARRRDRAAGRHQVARSGTMSFWDELTAADGGPATAASTSSPSTAARAVRVPRRWCSPTRSSLPFRIGFAAGVRHFAEAGLTDDVTFIGSGKLGSARQRGGRRWRWAADMVNVAREAMLAVGCIQAQKCHTDSVRPASPPRTPGSPTGSTPSRSRSACANYVRTLRRDLVKVSEAVRRRPPGLITPDDVEVADGNRRSVTLGELYGYRSGWGLPGEADREEITRLMLRTAATAPGETGSPGAKTRP